MTALVGILSLASIALAANPTFPAGSFLSTVPMEPTYHVPLTLGGHSPPLEGDYRLFTELIHQLTLHDVF
jgi:hypothetical protein